MKTKRAYFAWVGMAVASLSCGPSERETEINEYIWSLSRIPSDEPAVNPLDSSDPSRDGDFTCTITNLRETRQFDRIVAYAANSESLWPGAIVRGDSIYSGLFTPIAVERAPLSFSVSLESLEGGHSRELAEPSLSSYRDALSDVLSAGVDGATPANIYAELEEVHSQEQLSIALGASAKWLGSASSIAASFDFENESIRSRYLVKYTQAYYTVDVDPPSMPADFFAPSVTVDSLRAKVWVDNPPLYVPSITYGRMIVFTFESQYSAQELGAALEFAYRGGVDVSGDVSVTHRDVLSRSNISAYVLGGSGGEASKSIDSYDNLMEFIRSGGNYSKDSPGLPIAYKLAYVADSEPARMSLTEEYQVRECVRVRQKIKVTLNGIMVDKTGGDGAELELYGVIAAGAENEGILFARDDAHAVTINQGETWPSQGPLSEVVLDVVPKDGQKLYIFADLWDNDPWYMNDKSIGYNVVEVPFEAGWNKSVTMHLSGAGARVDIDVTLTPI
jgi:thiol-activated cytolysin